MKQALKLARKGLGKTSPNPMVGAILVKENRVIGQGYHRRYGGNHAEINAFQSARESLNGATLFVTLEPCCYHGKTPPCVDAIIQNKIGKVVIGTLDPNPRVNGRSVAILNQHGIETKVGVLEAECRDLNEAHFKYMTTGLPLVTLKFAQTLDGRIATATGDSKWISSDKFGRNPTRVILDSKLRIPLEAKVVRSQEMAPTIIATTARANEKKLACLREAGIEVLLIQEDESGEVDLKHLLNLLGERGTSSVLVEGGAGVITSLLRHHLADKVIIAIAPKIMGKGIEAVGELNICEVSQALKLSFSKIYRVGEDLVIEARVIPLTS